MIENDVDFIIAWVDGDDPAWRTEYLHYLGREKETDDWTAGAIRYRSWDTLRYWFRSVERYAPWVRKIHFVTWGHVPEWINLEHEKLNIVRHGDFIPEEYLPTFNINPIELNFHRIAGLAERFVYFNDDMFILKETCKNDFFRKGLPRDCAILDAHSIPPMSTVLLAANNTAAINRNFEKKTVLKKNFAKWFTPLYGGQVARTLLLLPWKRIPGFYEPHMPNSLIKSTYNLVWRAEGDVLHATCKHRFRNAADVTQWLIRDWQIASGMFEPRSPKCGKYFSKSIDEEIVRHVVEGRTMMACINDNATEESFEDEKALLIGALETAFPTRSQFELER